MALQVMRRSLSCQSTGKYPLPARASLEFEVIMKVTMITVLHTLYDEYISVGICKVTIDNVQLNF